MKPARIALLIWLTNAVLVCAVLVLVPDSMRNAGAERDAATEMPATRLKREAWKPSAAREGAQLPDVPVSPRQRPKVEVTEPIGERIEVTPTDEELRAEVEALIRRRYVLQHTAITTDGRIADKAVLLCGPLRIEVIEGMNLRALHGTPLAGAAADVDVRVIEPDHVMVNAASPRIAEKRFDVRLDVPAPKQSTTFMLSPPPISDTKHPADKLPRVPQPGPEQLRNTDNLNRELADKLIEEAARYVRSTAQGLQLTDELPEDSELYRHGARKGDILKAVNGKPVGSLGELRALGNEQYRAGTREFRIEYERDGVPSYRVIVLK